jgi:hypothetical protein
LRSSVTALRGSSFSRRYCDFHRVPKIQTDVVDASNPNIVAMNDGWLLW